MQPTIHTLEEIRLVDAGLISVRFIATLKVLVIEVDLGRSNFTDQFRGNADQLLRGVDSLAVEIHCLRCYWFQSMKTFETSEAAQLYMHDSPEDPDATSDIWDYAELSDEHSEQLRYWRAILGPSPLRHLRLSTSLEKLDLICEQIEVHTRRSTP